jgi:hypothetical protein
MDELNRAPRPISSLTTRALVTATMDDVPHLDEQTKAELLKNYLPHELEARTKGVPSLGRGAVYPLSQTDYTCDAFPIPAHFPRAYGLDVGWNWTAAVWWCWDRENDLEYIYREYQRAEAPPDIHASTIKANGEWIPGCIDPGSKARNQRDGGTLLEEYKELGLRLSLAFNAVDIGITHVYQRLASGKTKIFRSCTQLLEDMRFYRRGEDGVIIKERDHTCDAFRYVSMTGRSIAKVKPPTNLVTLAPPDQHWAWG